MLVLLGFPVPPFPRFLVVSFDSVPTLVTTLVFNPTTKVLIRLVGGVLSCFVAKDTAKMPIKRVTGFTTNVLFILPACCVCDGLGAGGNVAFKLIVNAVIVTIVVDILGCLMVLPTCAFFLGFPTVSTPRVEAVVIAKVLPFGVVGNLVVSFIFVLVFAHVEA